MAIPLYLLITALMDIDIYVLGDPSKFKCYRHVFHHVSAANHRSLFRKTRPNAYLQNFPTARSPQG
jgi:hypothetical protein